MLNVFAIHSKACTLNIVRNVLDPWNKIHFTPKPSTTNAREPVYQGTFRAGKCRTVLRPERANFEFCETHDSLRTLQVMSHAQVKSGLRHKEP